ITIEYRWGEGKDKRVPELVAELVSLNVGMLVTHGVRATIVARNASAKIPIVCFDCGDLVSTGVVESAPTLSLCYPTRCSWVGESRLRTWRKPNRLPAIFWTGDYPKVGGLIGYGSDGLALARRAASHVYKILKGAKAGELPVEQPTKFELVINA